MTVHPVELSLDPVPWSKQSQSSHGAASELRACAALMEAGYHVYRSESAHAPFDLVAYREKRLYRVEVKSLSAPTSKRSPFITWPVNDEWDLLMAVAEDHVFCFTAGIERTVARDVMRVHYGYEALGPKRKPQQPYSPPPPRSPWREYLPRVAAMQGQARSRVGMAMELGVTKKVIDRCVNELRRLDGGLDLWPVRVARPDQPRRKAPAQDQTHCASGHEYTEANSYIRPAGRRDCRQCGRERMKAYEERKRQSATVEGASDAAA